jgi:glutathione S-transferase
LAARSNHVIKEAEIKKQRNKETKKQRDKGMLDLYIANKNYSSWSLRPWIVLKMLGIAFNEHLTPFEGIDNFERFKRFSPNGKVPCLSDDSLVVWDSLAIIEYLAEGNPQVWPASVPARLYARSASSEMHAGFDALRAQCPMICSARYQVRSVSAGLARDLSRLDELFCEGLTRFGGDFLTGKAFSAADAFFCPVAIRVLGYGLPLTQPSLDYCQRLLALEPMKAWVLEALNEPWWDEAEEAQARVHADLIEDRRTLMR